MVSSERFFYVPLKQGHFWPPHLTNALHPILLRPAGYFHKTVYLKGPMHQAVGLMAATITFHSTESKPESNEFPKYEDISLLLP